MVVEPPVKAALTALNPLSVNELLVAENEKVPAVLTKSMPFSPLRSPRTVSRVKVALDVAPLTVPLKALSVLSEKFPLLIIAVKVAPVVTSKLKP